MLYVIVFLGFEKSKVEMKEINTFVRIILLQEISIIVRLISIKLTEKNS